MQVTLLIPVLLKILSLETEVAPAIAHDVAKSLSTKIIQTAAAVGSDAPSFAVSIPITQS